MSGVAALSLVAAMAVLGGVGPGGVGLAVHMRTGERQVTQALGGGWPALCGHPQRHGRFPVEWAARTTGDQPEDGEMC